MNDKELAEALVKAGICDKFTMREPHSGTAYQFPTGEPDNGWLFLTEESLVTDWRVAGKCLERWPTIINTEQLDMTLDEMLRNPASICKAFTQAIASQDLTDA